MSCAVCEIDKFGQSHVNAHPHLKLSDECTCDLIAEHLGTIDFIDSETAESLAGSEAVGLVKELREAAVEAAITVKKLAEEKADVLRSDLDGIVKEAVLRKLEKALKNIREKRAKAAAAAAALKAAAERAKRAKKKWIKKNPRSMNPLFIEKTKEAKKAAERLKAAVDETNTVVQKTKNARLFAVEKSGTGRMKTKPPEPTKKDVEALAMQKGFNNWNDAKKYAIKKGKPKTKWGNMKKVEGFKQMIEFLNKLPDPAGSQPDSGSGSDTDDLSGKDLLNSGEENADESQWP